MFSQKSIIYCILFISACVASNTTLGTDLTFYTCDDNNTCSTEQDEVANLSTEATLFTTDTFLNETKNVSVNISYKKPTRRNFDKENFCWCDLTINSCDINCCCDHDCSPDQKLIFSHCQTIEIRHDPFYCYSTDFIYINNTPFSWQKNKYGLFCIVRENLPAYHIVQVKEPIPTVNAAQDLIKSKYTWHNILHVKDEFKEKSYYKHGDRIWIKYKNEHLTPLSVPNNFLSTKCVQNKDVEFLNDFTTSCSPDLDENNPALNAHTYCDLTVLSLSVLQNSSVLDEYIHDCPKNICLPIQTYLCDDLHENCANITNKTLPKVSCHFNESTKEHSCFFVVKTVKYLFLHNGTYGLTDVHLYLYLTSAIYRYDDELFQFIQTFEVKFLWHDFETHNYSTVLSGNPGYILGKPILFAELINKVKNKTDSIIIEKDFLRNDADFTKNFLVLPKNVNGFCVLNNKTYEVVQFGYNSEYFCTHQVNFNKTTNASDVCREMQKVILINWQVKLNNNSNGDLYVGMFGNSNRSDISEWIQILNNFDYIKILENVTGNYENNKLVCQNLARSVKINILYANIDFKQVHNQPKILNIFYDLKTSSSERIILRDQKESLSNAVVNIMSEVMFFDVTFKKGKQFVEPPTLQIKLPTDFFYPFMSGSRGKSSFNSILFIYLSIGLRVLF